MAQRLRRFFPRFVAQPQARTFPIGVRQPEAQPFSPIYVPSDRDLRGSLIAPIFRRVVTVAATANVTAVINVPADVLWQLAFITCATAAGAAQTTTQIQLQINDITGTLIAIIKRLSNLAVVGSDLTFETEITLPPTTRLTASCDFNAGAAANTATLEIGGYAIPRGNVPAF